MRFFWSLLSTSLPNKGFVPFSAPSIAQSISSSVAIAFDVIASNSQDNYIREPKKEKEKKNRLCDRIAKAEAVWFQCLYFRLYSFLLSFLKMSSDGTVSSFAYMPLRGLFALFCECITPVTVIAVVHVSVCVLGVGAGRGLLRVRFLCTIVRTHFKGWGGVPVIWNTIQLWQNVFLCKYESLSKHGDADS